MFKFKKSLPKPPTIEERIETLLLARIAIRNSTTIHPDDAKFWIGEIDDILLNTM